MTVHGLAIESVDRTDAGFRVVFGCLCGDYTAEETTRTEADALAVAANEVRIHEATVTGAHNVRIRF